MAGPEPKAKEHHMATPAHKIRRGVLSVTIWKNTNDKNSIWYSVIPSRGYKQGDDAWKETDSLNADDLLPMGKLLNEADTWIADRMKADAKARKDKEAESAAA
jgi:hypothetical protein